jgi:hypothetical protein
MRASADTQAVFADAVNFTAFFLTNSSTLSGCWPVNVVHAAYSVGRALAIRQKGVAAKTGETTHEIELAVRAVGKHIRQLEDIETWAGTIESNSKKILDRSKRMRESLIDEV